MTGFGRGEAADDELLVVVEMKSVNHRFRDVRFKMSSSFSSLEIPLKQKISEMFKRGSFDIYVNVKKTQKTNRFDDLDDSKIKDYIKKMQTLSQAQGVELVVHSTEFLRQEFYLEQDDEKQKKLEQLLFQAFEKASQELKNSREGEGAKLVSHLNDHQESYAKYFQGIVERADEFKAHVEEKLKKRVAEYSSEIAVEESRLLQEVVFYLEKMDVHEEINRIHAHLEKLNKILSGPQEVGRQIDFLAQELNRETNTIGSKSSLKEISDRVVQMKVQLEKMREQGLNLE
jgi:uncharacterized protein (TIGR00255 family)